MGGSCTYSKHLPDYRDLDNNSGKRPGYKVWVIEKDGGVSIQMQDTSDESDSYTLKSIFLNVDEAKELRSGMDEAIKKASNKQVNHRPRGKKINSIKG